MKKVLLFILILVLLGCSSNEKKVKKENKKDKNLKEIYEEARAKEGPVIIPPQVDGAYLRYVVQLENNLLIHELLTEFLKYKKLKKKKPGQKIKGNMVLGAPNEYFNPSEENRRLAEIGKAIDRLLSSLTNKEQLKRFFQNYKKSKYHPEKLHFDVFTYYHVDVVGSGRFIYPHPPAKMKLRFKKRLNQLKKVME